MSLTKKNLRQLAPVLKGADCPPPVRGQKSEAGCSHITAKLSRTPQVDDQSLQANTGSLKFTQPAERERDKFHPSALNQSFTAGSVTSQPGEDRWWIVCSLVYF